MKNRDAQWLLDEKYGGDATQPGFAEDTRRLQGGEPVAYVIGHQPFLGLTIYLDSKPLIPRPETEWWTETLLNELTEPKAGLKLGQAALSGPAFGSVSGTGEAARSAPIFTSVSERPLSFLDLCAGSGAIGCAALALLPDATVCFGEINGAHEATIRKNIAANALDASRADIRIGDLFAPFGNLKFDLIATNPPYIPDGRALDESVTAHEPHEALFAGKDGLALIRRIAEELPNHLNTGGMAWIECDSSHAEAAKHLFETRGMRAEIRTDQYGKPRILVVSFP